jgi:hypothetical protein
MLKVAPIKTTSVGFGAGAAKPQPARIAMPTCSSPDRVDPNDQRNKGAQLKSGVSTNWKSHNPGIKRGRQ